MFSRDSVPFPTQAPNNVLSYSITGDSDGQKFFYIHPTDGTISLLKSVYETTKRDYRVRELL